MKHWSLRAKLTAWSAVVVAIAVFICAIGTVIFLRHEQIESVDRGLRNEARTFFREAEVHGGLSGKRPEEIAAFLAIADDSRYVEVVQQDGTNLYRSPNLKGDSLTRFARHAQTIIVANDRSRLTLFTKGPYTLFLAADLDEVDSDTKEAVAAMLIGLPSLLGLVALGGWWLARTALAPIREITAAAEQITAARLDQRLPIPASGGEIGRLAVVLNQTFDRLEQSFHQAVRFSADASHELKTPLAVLRASIEDLMDSRALAESDRKAIAALLEQTHRLSSITQSLLLLSRADAGRLRLDPVPTDLTELITACVDDARVMAEDRQITVDAAIPDDLQASVDAPRVSQILLNLLDNALKYNRERGAVRVSAEAMGDDFKIQVENTGPGILAENAPHLFTRFYRAAETSGTPGCGLGLSLSRELARAHGGDVILLDSDEGWTAFELRIRGADHDIPAS